MAELFNVKVQDLLKQEREKKKISLDEIHQKTKISIACLKWIEQGEWQQFPASVYGVGFLRKYAQCVGLSGDEVVSLYESEVANLKKMSAKNQTEEKKAHAKFRNSDPQGLVILILLFVLGFILFILIRDNLIKKGKSKGAVEQKNQTEDSRVNRFSELILAAKAEGSVWLRVVGDGKQLFQGFLSQGMENQWKAKNDFVIRIGNVPAITVTLNGKEIPIKAGAVKGVNELKIDSKFLKDGSLSPIKYILNKDKGNGG